MPASSRQPRADVDLLRWLNLNVPCSWWSASLVVIVQTTQPAGRVENQADMRMPAR